MGAAGFPRRVKTLLALELCSALGGGLTFPLLLIYLHEVRHFALALTGVLLAVPGLVGFCASAPAGALVDRLGARPLLVAGSAAAAAGSVAVVFVHGIGLALVALSLLGFGEVAGQTAFQVLLAQLLGDGPALVRAYSVNFTLINVGIGTGSLVAGAVVSLAHPGTFTLLYALDATSFAIPGVFYLASALPGPLRPEATPGGPVPQTAPGDSPPALPAPGYRAVLGDRAMRTYLVLTAFLTFAGYGSFTGYVAYSSIVVGASPRLIAWAFGANTAFIVASQHLVTGRLARIRRTGALALTAGAFALSWVVELAAGRFPHSSAGDGLVVCCALVFGAGEMCYSPVRGPLVNALAPEALRGRYNAAVTTVFQGSTVAGPPVAGALIGASLGEIWLGGLVGCAAAVVALARRLRHQLGAAEDSPVDRA